MGRERCSAVSSGRKEAEYSEANSADCGLGTQPATTLRGCTYSEHRHRSECKYVARVPGSLFRSKTELLSDEAQA